LKVGSDNRPPEGPPPQEEVGLVPVASNGSTKGRIALVVLAAVVTGALGLAALSRPDPSRNPPAGIAAIPSGDASSPGDLAARSLLTPGPASALAHVEEHVPDVPAGNLEGAPTPAFLRRAGDNLELSRWLPADDHLRPVATMPGVFSDIAPGGYLIASSAPGGRYAIVRDMAPVSSNQTDTVVIASPRGVIWKQDANTAHGSPIWSSDGLRVVVPITPGRWSLVELDGAKPVVRSLDVGDITPPAPPPDLPFVAHPVGFSANGRWLYGESTANADSSIRTPFRVPTAGGKAVELERLPTTGPGRLVADRVDSTSGRIVEPLRGDVMVPTELVVTDSNGSPAYRLAFPAILGRAWIGDGRLLVMVSNDVTGPRPVRLLAISPDGGTATPVIDAASVAGAQLLGTRDGFALLGFGAEDPRQEFLLAMIRMSDGARSGLRLERAELEGLMLGGWLGTSG